MLSSTVNDHRHGLVFLLWGKEVQTKCSFIDTKKHYILKAACPSHLSVEKGFFGCRHFSRANQYLKRMGRSEIDWCQLPKK